jgi:hypothetical protein
MKKILMGILTNIAAYVPVFVLIKLFKRTSSVLLKSKRLEKLIKNTDSMNNKNNFLTKKSKSMICLLPYWFKIFLFLFSFSFMASSGFLVTFIGNFYKKTQ